MHLGNGPTTGRNHLHPTLTDLRLDKLGVATHSTDAYLLLRPSYEHLG